MFFYEGQHCPVCGNMFSLTDDIVTCPVCGAPHHRDCWEKDGHCHFEHTHGTPEQWKRTEPQPAEYTPPHTENRCPNCGADNPEHAEFCARCGRTLDTSDWAANDRPPQYGQSAPYSEYTPFRTVFDPMGGVPLDETFDEDVTAKDLAVCVGGNTPYYLPRFQNIKNGRMVQWNWAAFLITPYWLLYRKQYVAGTLVSIFYLLFDLMVTTIFSLSGVYDLSSVSYTKAVELSDMAGYMPALFLLSVAMILICLFFGLFANKLYLNSCIKKVQEQKEADPNGYLPALRAEGGVSFIWGAVSYFSIGFLSSVISMFLL